MKKAWLALVFGSALFLAACGGDDNNNSSSSNNNNNNNTTEQTGGTAADGEKIVKANCTSCHGGNLEGMGSTPELNNVGSRLSEAEILEIIEKGRGGMPPGLLKGDDAKAAAAWLAQQK